mmetsp:Transcript_62206/g.148354  ORF Transcript_62206/g.148354 Transcript_62206/m.148354 type:complete len:229 (+) Transcript_62206:284-970(+)
MEGGPVLWIHLAKFHVAGSAPQVPRTASGVLLCRVKGALALVVLICHKPLPQPYQGEHIALQLVCPQQREEHFRGVLLANLRLCAELDQWGTGHEIGNPLRVQVILYLLQQCIPCFRIFRFRQPVVFRNSCHQPQAILPELGHAVHVLLKLLLFVRLRLIKDLVQFQRAGSGNHGRLFSDQLPPAQPVHLVHQVSHLRWWPVVCFPNLHGVQVDLAIFDLDQKNFKVT